MLIKAQQKWVKSRPPGLKKGKGPGGLWKNKSGVVWVPDEAKRDFVSRSTSRYLGSPRSGGDSEGSIQSGVLGGGR